jgi:hypothetical protein
MVHSCPLDISESQVQMASRCSAAPSMSWSMLNFGRELGGSGSRSLGSEGLTLLGATILLWSVQIPI